MSDVPGNPYRPPVAPVSDVPDPAEDTGFAVPGRVVEAGRGAAWIGEGWDLFKEAPLLWIVVLLLFMGIQFALGLVPVLGGIAGMLLGPVLVAGILAFARDARRGNADIGRLFAGFGDRLGPLMTLGVLYFALIAGMVVIMALGVAVVVGGSLFSHPDTAMEQAMAAPGLGLLVVLLLGLALLALLAAAYWYAPGLVFFAGLDATQAMKESFSACLRNWLPSLVYGILAVLVALAGTMLLGIGLLVAMPVLMASYYASFRDVFGRA